MLNSSLPTIAETLKKEDYSTASFNPNVQLIWRYCKELNLKRGFDVYETLLGKTRETFEFPVEKDNFLLLLFLNLITSIPIPLAIPAPRAEIIDQEAVSWLKDVSEPFFLWLFYLDSHHPYLPRTQKSSLMNKIRMVRVNRKLRYFESSLSTKEVDYLHKLYVREIEELDMEIGKFINWLKGNGLYKNATLIFTADHGEQFREHGYLGHPAKLYDEQIRVPLIIKTADSRRSIVNTLVSHLDLAPTIVEQAGIKLEKNMFLGQCLTSTPFAGESQQKAIMSFANYYGIQSKKRHYCYRTDEWKLIVEENKRELYNLNRDPMEKRNLCKDHPEIVRKMESEAQSYVSRLLRIICKAETEKQRIRKIIKKGIRYGICS